LNVLAGKSETPALRMKTPFFVLAGSLLALAGRPLHAQTAARSEPGGQPAASSSAEANSTDAISGEYKIVHYSSSDGSARSGSVSISKQGPLYALTFRMHDEPKWQGIAFALAPRRGANTELWAAIGSEEMVSLGIYQAREGTFQGVWYPLNAAEDHTVYGNEVLVGSPNLAGHYQLSGNLPNGGGPYAGVMKVEPGTAALNGDGQTCLFKWTTGTLGPAFRIGDLVAVCAGWGRSCQIVRFRIESGTLAGEFFSGDKTTGSCTLAK
jgi:hypothetical protein